MNGVALPVGDAALKLLFEELSQAAHARRFAVAPNPCVGAAVLAGSRVVARGVHEIWGGAHAEVNAFEAARASDVPQSEWDTLVVTLEPCNSVGKTPACTEAILEAGIKTVIVGGVDPDPRSQGAGLDRLRAAGVDVRLVVGASRLEEVSPHFLRWNARERVRRPRPWVIAKWAQTLSGQLLPPKDIGDGRWISSPPSLAAVHELRARVDAIVTGVGTVLADDPRMNVRPPGHTQVPPARIIFDSSLRMSPTARMFAPSSDPANDPDGGPIHILCQRGVDRVRMRLLEEAGAHVHEMRGDDRQHLTLRDVQTWLWEQGFRRILLESGPQLTRAYFDAGFIDQVRVVTGQARGGRGESLAATLAETKLVERSDYECGDDAVLDAFVKNK